jgi:hypothetical protein
MKQGLPSYIVDFLTWKAVLLKKVYDRFEGFKGVDMRAFQW